MKTTSRTKLLAIALVVVLITLACGTEPTLQDYQEMMGNEPTVAVSLGGGTSEPVYDYGDVGGSMSTYWTDIWIDNVVYNPVCTDDQATFHLYIGETNIPPAGSPDPGSLPRKQQYFRLDAYAVRYMPDNKTGGCNMDVNRSDEMTHFTIAGGYDASTYKFYILTCGNTGAVASGSEIYHTSGFQVTGTVVCGVSDQMKQVFSFSDMFLHTGTGNPAP